MVASHLKSFLRHDFTAAGLALLMASGSAAAARDLSPVNPVSKINPLSNIQIKCEADIPGWKVACSDPVPFTLPTGINNHGVSVGITSPTHDLQKSRNATVFPPLTAPRDIFTGSLTQYVDPVSVTDSGKILASFSLVPNIQYGAIYTAPDRSLAPGFVRDPWKPLDPCKGCLPEFPTPVPIAMSLTDDVILAGEIFHRGSREHPGPDEVILQRGDDTASRREVNFRFFVQSFRFGDIAHIDGTADDYYVMVNAYPHIDGTWRGVLNYRTGMATGWQRTGDNGQYVATVDTFGNIGGSDYYFDGGPRSYTRPFIKTAEGTLFHINVTVESDGGESCRPDAFIDKINDGLQGVGHASGCGLSDAGFSFMLLKEAPRPPAAALPPSVRPTITRVPQPMPGH